MLEKVLKTLLGIMLMVMFMQHIVKPVIDEAIAARIKVASVRATLEQMASAERSRINKVLNTERQMIDAYFGELNKMLPDFQTSRSVAITRLENLREVFQGEWLIKPGMQPVYEGQLVRWPITVRYTGSFASVLKLLRHLETDEFLTRTRQLSLNKSKDGNAVILDAGLELLFRDSSQTAEVAAINSVGGLK